MDVLRVSLLGPRATPPGLHTHLVTGELGRDSALPLLPLGSSLFDGLPYAAVVLDALAPAVANGMITLRDGVGEGVLVIREGAIADSVWVANGIRSWGENALSLIRQAGTSMVSACRLSDEAMDLMGPLIRGVPCYADLRLEWVVWPHLLNDLRERVGTFVVEITTPTGRGVTVIRAGRILATFSESHPALGDDDLLDALAAGGVGTIRVLVDRDVEPESELRSPPTFAAVVRAPQREEVSIVRERVANPEVAVADDPNATLSALFGPRLHSSHDFVLPGSERMGRQPDTQVESLLPQLKLLVQSRLQRSSETVLEVVDAAAMDRQCVGWLADRVRVMTIRGFLHSTFDQLADDMLALTVRAPD